MFFKLRNTIFIQLNRICVGCPPAQDLDTLLHVEWMAAIQTLEQHEQHVAEEAKLGVSMLRMSYVTVDDVSLRS